MKLILASTSPRRRMLLEQAGLDFTVIAPPYDEYVLYGTAPADAADQLAVLKARAVAGEYPRDIVVGADTVVTIDGLLLGKPLDKTDAMYMLEMLSGRKHVVYTGVCVLFEERERSFVQRTEVEFYPLSLDSIRAYIATGEPMDKAGGYGIQGRGMAFVKGIIGDYYNVVGLPVARLLRILDEIGDIEGLMKKS